MSFLIENKLKNMSVTELENVIAKAVSDATGQEFESTISAIEYDNTGWPGASFKIQITQPMNTEWMKNRKCEPETE